MPATGGSTSLAARRGQSPDVHASIIPTGCAGGSGFVYGLGARPRVVTPFTGIGLGEEGAWALGAGASPNFQDKRREAANDDAEQRLGLIFSALVGAQADVEQRARTGTRRAWRLTLGRSPGGQCRQFRHSWPCSRGKAGPRGWRACC